MKKNLFILKIFIDLKKEIIKAHNIYNAYLNILFHLLKLDSIRDLDRNYFKNIFRILRNFSQLLRRRKK